VTAVARRVVWWVWEQVLGSGHALCMARLNAQHDLSGWLDEQMGGVTALQSLRQLQR
jgi:Zn-dependent M16 (insulinase) family peptidase